MPDKWDEMADVVVVGSGGAALTAAYVAAVRGFRTLVVEKTRYFGGTSAYSGSCIWLPGNHVLREAGIDDTVERGLEYFRAVVGDRTPAAKQRAFVETGPELVEFLARDPVLTFQHMPFPDYHAENGRRDNGRGIFPKPLRAEKLGPRLDDIRPPITMDQFDVPADRTYLHGGQALIARLLMALDATGNAVLRTNTSLRTLVTDDGRVVGVETTAGRFAAAKAVILGAGGFENNAALRQEHQGLPGADWSSSAPGSNTGDAMAAARAIGAAVDLLDASWWCPAVLFPNGRAAFTLGLTGGIFVNEAGERYANESLPYHRMGLQLQLPTWWVFDGRFDSTPGITQPPPDFAAFQDAGLWRTADTVEGLAEQIGVPADVLGKTVTRFNGFAVTGRDDDFGRGADPYDRFFARGDGANPCLVPIDRAPFHAVRIVLGDLGTKGGLVTDEDAHVLDTSGAVIPGLFAIGNSAASVAGNTYPGPGVPLGSGMVFGYRAVTALT